MMCNLFLVFVAIFSLSMIGCSDDTSTGSTPTVEGDYFPMTTGSTWTYKKSDSTENSVTVSSETLTINGKVYKAITSSDSSDSGLRREGTTVYMLFPDSTFNLTEVPVLKEQIGATWSYKLWAFFFTLTFNNKTVELLPTRVVRGTTYSSVLRVHSDLLIETLPAGSSDTYYAKGVGRIEVAGSGDAEAKAEQLMSYTIQ